MTEIRLEWHKTRDYRRIPESAAGVYLIYEDGSLIGGSKVLYVGQGNIQNRMIAHESEVEFEKYLKNPNTIYYWATVSNGMQHNGVEKYLIEYYNYPPLNKTRGNGDTKIKVNTPV